MPWPKNAALASDSNPARKKNGDPMMPTRLNRNFLLITFFLVLLVISFDASAQVNNAGLLDSVLNRYKNAAGGWASYITERASYLFWILVVISMVWTFGIMAVRRADLGEFFAEFIKFTVFTGFFWWLLVNGPQFANDIITSLRNIGERATGNTGLTPSTIIDMGFSIFSRTIEKSSFWSPVNSAAGILMSLAFLIVLALVSINMLILLISGWVLAYAGVFFLGFGGSRWTSDMAINYFKTILSLAAQLFTMVLLIGIGESFVNEYYSAISSEMALEELGVLLIASVILLVLVNKLPPMIGGLAMGGGTHALGSGFGAGAAVGATAAAGAAAATAGAMAAAGAANLAGGAQAIQAAFRGAASQQASAGAGAAAAVAATGIDLKNSLGGTNQSFGPTESASPLEQAMGSTERPADAKTEGSSKQQATKEQPGADKPTPTAKAETHVEEGDTRSVAKDELPPPGDTLAPGQVQHPTATLIDKVKQAGAITAGATANLALGVKDVMGERMSQSISETFGGKVKEAIKARTAQASAKGTESNVLGNLAKGISDVLRENAKARIDETTGARIRDAIEKRVASRDTDDFSNFRDNS